MKTDVNKFNIDNVSDRIFRIAASDSDGDGTVSVFYRDKLIHGGKIGHDDAVISGKHLRIIREGTCEYGLWNFPLDNDDEFYGLGDKTGLPDRRGRRFSMFNKDALSYDASFSDPLYKSIPFFIKINRVKDILCGYFFPSLQIDYVDFGRESPLYFSVRQTGGPYEYYVIAGDSIDEILSSYYSLTGKPYLPPLYSFGYFGSSMNYVEGDDAQSQILSFFENVEKRGIPCEGMYLSSGYLKQPDSKRYTFMWNTEKFPDPSGFFASLQQRGYRFLQNIKPGFLKSHPMYDELDKKGYFIKDSSGRTVLEYYWGGEASFIDFDNPDAVSWWKSQLALQPCDGIWNDNNELEIDDPEVPWSRKKLLYGNEMSKAAYEAKKELHADERPWIYSRSGTAGLQKYARTWTGDNTSTFETLRYNQYMGLSLSLSGIPFYGHDLGGFFGETPSRQLLLDACRSGVIQSRFVIHSWRIGGSATEPWTYEDIEPDIVALIKQHYYFLPYIYSCAYEAVSSGRPMESPCDGGIMFGNCIVKHDDYSFDLLPGSAIPVCPLEVKNSSEIFDELEILVTSPDASSPHESTVFIDDGVSELDLRRYSVLKISVLPGFIKIRKEATGYPKPVKITFVFENGTCVSFNDVKDVPDIIEY